MTQKIHPPVGTIRHPGGLSLQFDTPLPGSADQQRNDSTDRYADQGYRMKQPPGGRTQQRLADLHRSVSAAVQNLHQHQLVVVTALRGGDASMQQSVLEEHQSRVASAMQELAALNAFVDRLRTTDTADSQDLLRAG